MRKPIRSKAQKVGEYYKFTETPDRSENTYFKCVGIKELRAIPRAYTNAGKPGFKVLMWDGHQVYVDYYVTLTIQDHLEWVPKLKGMFEVGE